MPDKVEIKVNVEGDAVDGALARLGLDPDRAQRFRIRFAEYRRGCDGQVALPLTAVGTILRVREWDDHADSTLKVRRATRGELPHHLPDDDDRGRHRFKLEGDWTGPHRQLSASADATFADGLPGDLDRTPELAFTGPQVTFLHHANVLPIDLRAVEFLTPIAARRWKPVAPLTRDPEHEVAAEQWTVDHLRLLELSVRADPGEAEAWQARLILDCLEAGVKLSSNPRPKTSRVLRHLVRRH